MTDNDLIEQLEELAKYVEQQPPVQYEQAAASAMREAARALRSSAGADVETIVRLILEQEEHYTTDATPLTPDHVFGQHVLELRPRKAKLLPKSAAHLEQRIRAITASVLDTLGGVS